MSMGSQFRTIPLIAAPPAMQPGAYVPEAYQDRVQPLTPSVDIAASRQGNAWLVELRWDCPKLVGSIAGETDLFTDAAAIMVPGTMDAPWVTMGAPGQPVEAVLWRADKDQLWQMRAQGLGTMKRHAAPANWSVESGFENGRWHLHYRLGDWPWLSQFGLLGVAIWRGEQQDRGGLKSVTSHWLTVA